MNLWGCKLISVEGKDFTYTGKPTNTSQKNDAF